MNNAATTDANGQKHETPARWRPGERGEEPQEGKVKHRRRDGQKGWGGGEEVQSLPASCQDFPVVHFSGVSK